MKLIVGIVASDNANYTEFKNIWIKNIIEIKKNPLLCELIDFYFLYSDENGQSKQIKYKTGQVLYTDFYDNKEFKEKNNQEEANNYPAVTISIFNRTIEFYKYIKDILNLDNNESYIKYRTDGLYFLRTNISTLFDFKQMVSWLDNKPKANFFGGSFNGYYNNMYTTISGTNMIFSLDLMMYLCYNYENADIKNYLEDEAISTLIITNLNVFLINVKRLDFIEMKEVVLEHINHFWPATPNSVVYHKTNAGDNNVFTFRFKTFNRKNDIKAMNLLLEEIHKNNYNLTNFVEKYVNSHSPPLPISEEGPTYGKLYSETPFKIINL